MASLKADWQNFKQDVEKRRITRVVHFTTVTNLIGIIELGSLLSRTILEDLKKEIRYYQPIDILRIDGMRDYICLSIQHPNYHVFQAQQRRYSQEEWCVIVLDPQVLWWEHTKFAQSNAASTFAIGEGIGGSWECYQALFKGNVVRTNFYNSRTIQTRKHLKDCYPTDEQAEILVLDEVPFEFFKKVYFRSTMALFRAKQLIMTKIDSPLFEDVFKIFDLEDRLWEKERD